MPPLLPPAGKGADPHLPAAALRMTQGISNLIFSRAIYFLIAKSTSFFSNFSIKQTNVHKSKQANKHIFIHSTTKAPNHCVILDTTLKGLVGSSPQIHCGIVCLILVQTLGPNHNGLFIIYALQPQVNEQN